MRWRHHKDGGQYIPNPATWLNQQRWEDILPEAEKPSGIDTDQDQIATIRRMLGG